MAEPQLTILNRYELIASASSFKTAIAQLVARVHDEGHSGVVSYRFFVNGDEKSARGVIDYEDASAWIGHHDIAMEWPEMKALHAVAKLTEVFFLGSLTPEIQSWIKGSTLTATIQHGNSCVAGFKR